MRGAANVTLVLLGMAAIAQAGAQAPERKLDVLKSGIEFQTDSVRQLQADEFSNPGLLWVTRGEQLWSTTAGREQKSCANCHQQAAMSMKGVATRYPAFDKSQSRVLDLEARINSCRVNYQGAAAFPAESDELLGLTAFVAQQSRGMPLAVSIDGAARPVLDAGRALYYQRIGQLNLACNHCHEQNFDRSLLNQPITQGHGNGYPAYRLDWQKMGSLQRRLRACFYGIRAELPAFGSDDLIALELFLAWRAQGLTIETPAVRR
ncbi:MAG TPA: sulfur oxidation c-type cytochrome SoxA [Usitatibacteraceae bacterium]